MAGKVTNAGEVLTLEHVTNKSGLTSNLILRLFSDNETLDDTDTAGDFTEVTGGSYAAITLTGATWTVTGGSPSSATYPEQTFTFSAGIGNVYGYMLTRTSDGKIFGVERFSDGPYNIANAGDTIKVTPTITAKDTTE